MDRGHVLIVDPDDEWRASTGALLTRLGLDVVEAPTGAEAISSARDERPALVLSEVSLEDVDGFELCRELRDACGDSLPIILVSTDPVTARDRIAALLIGADDYLAKSEDRGELVARVRRHVSRTSTSTLTSRRTGPSANGTSFGLTKRELEILQRLAVGETPAEIAEKLFISPKTVSSHVQRILAKMKVHSRLQAVALAYGQGLIETPGDVELHLFHVA